MMTWQQIPKPALRCARVLVALLAFSSACARQPEISTPSLPTPAPTATAPATATVASPTPAMTVTAQRDAGPTSGTPITQTLERLGAYHCPSGRFTCLTLSMPLDHFAPAGDVTQTIDVVFAVLPASGERTGMFVTAVGGPGSSGVALADSYTDALDPSIPEHFDMVFFDQRGIGLSGGMNCPNATTVYYRTDGRADTPEQEANVIAAAQTFATTCIQEIGAADDVSHMDTRQAAEDLEWFRQTIGDDQFWLYGESYGTQLAQTYAASHTQHLAGMILDGTVDLTLPGQTFAQQATEAFESVLQQTLAACDTDAACSADVAGPALRAYDQLAASLAQQPISFTFPLPAPLSAASTVTGTTATRALSRADLDTAAAGYLNAPDERMLLQRAVAAASHGDIVPMARLLYSALGLDEETSTPVLDPTYSDAAYYAVTCSDYVYFTGTPQQRARAFIEAGKTVAASAPRLSSIFYGDLPCVFWPSNTPSSDERPVPLRAEGVPTLVLGATADPLTPVGNARNVYDHLADGYLIVTEGGAHVTFGRGDACPDDIVTAFLVEGQPPEQRETTCEGVVASSYTSIAPQNASAFANPLDAMQSAYDEIMHLPEYWYWDGATTLRVGCTYGGMVQIEHASGVDQMNLNDCAFSQGFHITGNGEYDGDSDHFAVEATITGQAEFQFAFEAGADGASVRGTYAGKPVDLSKRAE
ncbi:MAG: alpha/beta hydrolase [Chloroflexi bacterium]|nr:alpha/beta hydrolase [Chloroflexota bacterium]